MIKIRNKSLTLIGALAIGSILLISMPVGAIEREEDDGEIKLYLSDKMPNLTADVSLDLATLSFALNLDLGNWLISPSDLEVSLKKFDASASLKLSHFERIEDFDIELGVTVPKFGIDVWPFSLEYENTLLNLIIFAMYRESFELGISLLPPKIFVSTNDFYPIASFIPVPILRDIISYVIDFPISMLIDIDVLRGFFSVTIDVDFSSGVIPKP